MTDLVTVRHNLKTVDKMKAWKDLKFGMVVTWVVYSLWWTVDLRMTLLEIILIYVMSKTIKGFVLFLIGGKYLSCSPVIHVNFVLKGNVSHIKARPHVAMKWAVFLRF